MTSARQSAGLAEIDIAVRVGRKDPITVKRWERGENWPQNIDQVLATYADAAGLDGPRGMWELALQLWREHDEDPATRFEAEAERAGQPPDGHDQPSATDPPGEGAEDASR